MSADYYCARCLAEVPTARAFGVDVCAVCGGSVITVEQAEARSPSTVAARLASIEGKIDRLVELQTEVARLRATILTVEWVFDPIGNTWRCPWCLRSKVVGHDTKCMRQGSLGLTEWKD